MKKETQEKSVQKGLPDDDYYVVIEKHADRVYGFVMTLVLTQLEMQAFPASDAVDAIRFRTQEQADGFCRMPDPLLMKAHTIEFVPFHVTKELKGKTQISRLFPIDTAASAQDILTCLKKEPVK
jgi:hypothetical protein